MRLRSSLCVLELSHYLSTTNDNPLSYSSASTFFDPLGRRLCSLDFISRDLFPCHPPASLGSDFKCHERLESQSFPICPTLAQVTERPEFHLSSPSSSFPPLGAGDLEGALCTSGGTSLSSPALSPAFWHRTLKH